MTTVKFGVCLRFVLQIQISLMFNESMDNEDALAKLARKKEKSKEEVRGYYGKKI